MAGWSKLADGSAFDCLKPLQKLLSDELWFDLGLGSKGEIEGGEEDKLRSLFDQFVSVFLKEIHSSYCFRPLPPMLGDGQSVDLFKLFLAVRENGGYETVSKNELWDSVAEKSGFSTGVASAVKLIYVKYLDSLDRWLKRIVENKDSKSELPGSGVDLGGFFMGLESEFSDLKKKDGEYPHLDLEKSKLDQKKKDGEYPHLDLEKSELDVADGKPCSADEFRSSVESSGGKESIKENKDNIILDSSVIEEEISNRKRKQDCNLGLLDWVIEVAKNPCDPQFGSLPDRSKRRSYGSDQLRKQVLLARKAMFLKTRVDQSTEHSVWQKKQKMHPSMYDDHTGSERSRCSQRLLSVKEYQALLSLKKSRACSEFSSGSDLEDHLDKQPDPSTADSIVGLYMDNHRRKRIPVGPFFQAKVPEWTGEIYESDSKWLGTQVWPVKGGGNKKYLIERERIGKGRQESCGCQLRGSIECVRFHVVEKRMRVKLELDSAFHSWKFDKMGEEVALSWKKEEKKKFQAIVRSNPASMDKCYWDEMFKSFPGKSREDLVSYYFNVFLLQRRAHQNRSNPSNIDSDDDESELESINNGFGHEAGSILRTPKKAHLNFR